VLESLKNRIPRAWLIGVAQEADAVVPTPNVPVKPSARLPGRRPPPPAGSEVAEPVGFKNVRVTGERVEAALQTLLTQLRPGLWARPEKLNMLALSGGGAGGAFGAGALVGLTRAGKRPRFQITTGVSTGGFIAPFAFLGPDWDERLEDAFTGGHSAALLSLRGFAGGLGPGLYRSDPLERMVGSFIDQPLVDAVAREHAGGRRLFVATTNLDTQKPIIWDMGAIAAHGGPEALRLFIDVLIASASLPGLFPPRMMPVEAGGQVYEEMHLDGGLCAPLFIAPEDLVLNPAIRRAVRGGQVYALVNTTLGSADRTVPMGALPIAVRSFETMLRFSYRQAVNSTAAFCHRHALSFSTAAIPNEYAAINMLKFEQTMMREIFEHGVRLAESGKLWTVRT
jgi:predicted acylesterase/phospholipase RssA